MKSKDAPCGLTRWSRLQSARSRYGKFVAGAVLVLGLVAVSFIGGVAQRPAIESAVDAFGASERPSPKTLLESAGNYVKARFKSHSLETLVLDVKFKHMSKLALDRDTALKQGTLNTSGDDYVPASIRYKDKTVDVKIRLKGDNTDHLESDKWSFMVRVKDNDQLFGMRRFSLMNPSVRADQQEPMAYAYLRESGFLAPRYLFVNLVVNGVQIGVMALEEYPAKELLESQGRRESVVVRFDESQLWADRETSGIWDDSYDNFAVAPIKVAEEGKTLQSEKLTKDLGVAAGLLKGFVRGELAAADVFDVEEYGKFLAALELLNARNGFWWANLRFYYNPISARLEPVASDLMSEKAWGDPDFGFHLHAMSYPATRSILADPGIREVYVRELSRLATKVAEGSLEALLRPLEERYLSALHRDAPMLPAFDYAQLKRRAAHLSTVTLENLDYFNVINETDHAESRLIFAETYRAGDTWNLELTNVVAAPVEILSVKWHADPSVSADQADAAPGRNFPIELLPTANYARPAVVTISLTTAENPGLEPGVELEVRIKGTERSSTVRSSPTYKARTTRPMRSVARDELLARLPFLREIDETTIGIRPGEHRVPATISLPDGFDLTIEAGTTLLFASDAGLVVRGGLKIEGTAENGVLLDGSGDAGGIPGWPGLLVLGSGKSSELSHVTIRNTTGVVQDDWEVTGGVTFYGSKLQAEAVQFEDNRAEDALNLVHSEFVLQDVVVRNTVSDGLDSDFSKGTILGGEFEKIGTAGGGDAIDISGSVVSVSGTRIRHVSDKALSVGEGSELFAEGVLIDGVLTGGASKDASRLVITDSLISNYQIAALMAYVKKPEYGASLIEASRIEFGGTDEKAMVQTGSEIRIDGRLIPDGALDVDALYESFMSKAKRS